MTNDHVLEHIPGSLITHNGNIEFFVQNVSIVILYVGLVMVKLKRLIRLSVFLYMKKLLRIL